MRRNAGLGDPPDPYYNNIPESANAIIKRAVEYEPKEMSNFITEMEGLITQQKKDCEAAVINRGPYTLVDEEKSLEIPPEKWFKMNVNQREHALQKYWKRETKSKRVRSPKMTKNARNRISFRIPALSQSILNNQGWRVYPCCCLKIFFPRHQSNWPPKQPYCQHRRLKRAHLSLEMTMVRDHTLYFRKLMEK